MEKRSLLRWSPLIGLLIGVVLASWLGLHITLQNQEDIDENFDLIVQRAAAQIERRMQLYEYGLRGTRGAVIASGEERIDREAFTRYSASRDYAREFPGARGFGFIRRVPARDEAAFLRAARNDGWPGFSILQLSSHDGDRFVIQYVGEVERNKIAIGLISPLKPTDGKPHFLQCAAARCVFQGPSRWCKTLVSRCSPF